MQCYICDSDLIWNGDDDYEGMFFTGIETHLSCTNKDCRTEIVVYHNLEDIDEDSNSSSHR